MKRVQAAQKQAWLFVLSGPSGSGKTTLADGLVSARSLKGRIARSVSFTTRPRRGTERHGKDYFFISREEFLRLKKAKKILEWTRYLGYYYGTARDFVTQQLGRSRGLIFCLDIRGARQIKAAFPRRAVTIFIMPPSIEELARRIKTRCRTGAEEIARRVAAARREVRAARTYDYVVINDRLAGAHRQLRAIIEAYV